MSKKILILGNGFDLDLGMKSRYRDFMASEVWKKIKEDDFTASNCSLIRYLEKKNEIESWFDAETELLNYALQETEGTYASSDPNDRAGFDMFRKGLKEYLKKEQDTFQLKRDSVAIKILEAIYRNEYFDEIFSFNYTDVGQLLNKTGIHWDSKVTYMHGSLQNNDDIILGIETDLPISKNYRFLFKTNSRFYKSNSLIESMENANEIVFFGHSINGMDFPYFKDFFMKQVNPYEDTTRKYITIVTYDDDSLQQIKDNFRDAGINPRDLMQRNQIWNIETKLVYEGDAHEKSELEDLFNHLRMDCKERERQNIKRIEEMML